ncbi:MAG TPA: M48 family metallopeptidase [Ktedonobacteraceae bacterium]|nr:M48 family metallopeptidase [Ktedonobacteraceae bacterium]
MEMEIEAGQPAQQVEIDQERQVKAKAYARIRRRLSYISMGIAAAGVCLLLFTGIAGWLRDLLRSLDWQPVHGWFPLQVLCFFLIVMLIYEIVTAPLGYYGFRLSHRYGLSVMTIKSWLRDLFVGLLLELVLGIAAFEFIYWLLAAQPDSWWLWVALALLFFSVIMANLAPVLLFPLFYKFRPLPEGELTQRLMALAKRANTRVRGVYTFDMSRKTTAANAALMGLGNTRRIVLGDTMLDRYSNEEIEVVLAHELGHHVHHDIWKLIISQSLITLAGLYLANVIFHQVVDTHHLYAGFADTATIPLLLALMALFGFIVMPLNNGFSRYVEYHADEYALQSTRMIEPFKSAMTRLANQNLSDIAPSPIIEFLFYDHPSTGKRLKHAGDFVLRL